MPLIPSGHNASVLARTDELHLGKRMALLIIATLFSLTHIHCTDKKPVNAAARSDSTATSIEVKEAAVWVAPDSLWIPRDENAELILYGRSLLTHTSEYFGPRGSITHATNGMNCQNCHLTAGTRPFGNNYSAVYSTYPKFRARSGSVESIVKRVNDCFERSLNGKPLDSTSREMQAIIAYMKWLGQDVEKGKTPKGAGLIELNYLDRAADPALGKLAFDAKCVTCHGADGQGKLSADGRSYQYPPLWGPHSYNTGAGLYRLSRFAGFIKGNMPYGTTYLSPQLTDEEAWDIAAYVNSMDRPDKPYKHDWPDISKKPIDFPSGPYADTFSVQQHKYGPFTAIQSFYKKPK